MQSVTNIHNLCINPIFLWLRTIWINNKVFKLLGVDFRFYPDYVEKVDRPKNDELSHAIETILNKIESQLTPILEQLADEKAFPLTRVGFENNHLFCQKIHSSGRSNVSPTRQLGQISIIGRSGKNARPENSRSCSSVPSWPPIRAIECMLKLYIVKLNSIII